jgi:hypothetical protein
MKRLGTVGIAIAGVLALVQGLTMLAYPISFVNLGGAPWNWGFFLMGLLSLVPAVLCFALGWFLIRRRERLAERWFTDADVPGLPAIGPLVRAALVVMGAWLLVTAIPAAFTLVMSPITLLVPSNANFENWPVAYVILTNVPGLIGRLIEIGLGAALVARSTQLTGWLLRSRPAAPVDLERAATAACPTCGTPYDPADHRDGVAPATCEECGEPLDVSAVPVPDDPPAPTA